jgi:DNA-binding Lrp family transcriptional regulator
VGRRWRKLTTEGRAWISSAPGPALPLVGAIIEIVWRPDKLHDAAHALVGMPQVFSVNLTSGPHNAYALLVTSDTASLNCLLVEGIPNVANARIVTSSLLIELFSAHWRLGAIANDAARALSETNPETYASPSEHALDDFDKDLFVALQLDGRRSVRDLALDMNRSEHAVKRRLEHLRRTDLLTFRTDFVRAEGGWAVQVKLSLRVPDETLSEVGHRVAAWPETRVCAACSARQTSSSSQPSCTVFTPQTNYCGAFAKLGLASTCWIDK